jgi:predicted MFS family arabinose efflux permease
VVLSESRPAERPRLDLPGAVTVTLGLLAIVYGLTTAGEKSWAEPAALAAMFAGAALLVIFWMIERRVSAPLVPVSILRRRTVGWGNLAGLLAFATETSLVFLLTLYLQKVLGYSPLAAGLSFAVLGAGTVLGGIVGPKVIGRIGSRNSIVAGLVVQTMATIPLVLLGETSAWLVLLLLATFVGGVANLVTIVGFMVTATSGLPDQEQGLATGLTTMSQQIGITMGTPVMSAVATATIHSLGGEASGQVLTGVTTAIAVNAALCLVTAVLVAVFLPSPKPDRALVGAAA